jgi:MFS transporter, ACS family, tartrate transporter
VPEAGHVAEKDQVFTKCAWRLIPLMGLLYLVNYLDRVNVGFAALTMNRDLAARLRCFRTSAITLSMAATASEQYSGAVCVPQGPKFGF